MAEVLGASALCEWCGDEALQGFDLCLDCHEEWSLHLVIPVESGSKVARFFCIHTTVMGLI